jgi:hypothetical protein
MRANYVCNVKYAPYPDLTFGGGKAGLISEPTLYLLGLILYLLGLTIEARGSIL